MKKLSFAFLLLFATISQVFSQTAFTVDKETAYRTAKAFSASHQTLNGQELKLVSADGIYIYNIGDQGFVIVSGNTVLPPVLAWSNQGTIPDLEDAPDNFRFWMGRYNEMIDFATANGLEPEATIQRQWDDVSEGILGTRDVQAVAPMISTLWNQDCYYNALCPSTGGGWWGGGPCGHAYAGCVACAMAQIMKYWNHPEHGFGSHSYVHGQYGTQSADFGSTTYQWSQMPNEVWHNVDAVATLMYHCGVSVNMNYGPDGSGAYSIDVEDAMRSYFGYCGAKYLSKSSFQDQAWNDMLRAELDLSHPIYYSGSHDDSGHAFVCDGYDGDYFHFNFGWSGSGNGYYSTYDVNGFNENQAVVTHIYPVEIQADANGIIYVTEDGQGNGSSWDNATSNLELATAFSKGNGIRVWVKKGTYYGDVTNPEGAFYISSGNRVYGGFYGDEAPDYDLSLRDFVKNATILDGQNERRVLNLDNALTAGTAAVWDGFTVINGAAGSGAGVFLNNYVTLSNFTIKQNAASMFGGGIYINSTGGTAHVSINHCVICDNSASMGGGICDRIGSNYTNCRISNNTAITKGGGIYLYNNAEPVFKNCIFNNNTAKNAGAMYARGKFTAYNCDIVMNLGTESVGGIFNENHNNKYYNCILWGNMANGLPSQTDGISDYEYCAVQGGVDGLETIDLPAENSGNEPGGYIRFNHPASGVGADYHNDDWSLKSRSICINAGKPNTMGLGNTDIAGNLRLQKGRVDIGAYESCASLTQIEDAFYESDSPYWFFSRPLTEPGYYTQVLDGPDCDSVIGLNLMVLEGLTETSENAIQVWPNPTNDLLHIEAQDIDKLEIRNLLGQLVLEARKAEILSLEGFEKGVYFLIASNKNGVKTVTKVIKE